MCVVVGETDRAVKGSPRENCSTREVHRLFVAEEALSEKNLAPSPFAILYIPTLNLVAFLKFFPLYSDQVI